MCFITPLTSFLVQNSPCVFFTSYQHTPMQFPVLSKPDKVLKSTSHWLKLAVAVRRSNSLLKDMSLSLSRNMWGWAKTSRLLLAEEPRSRDDNTQAPQTWLNRWVIPSPPRVYQACDSCHGVNYVVIYKNTAPFLLAMICIVLCRRLVFVGK